MKGLVNVAISLGALLISIVVMAALKFINATEIIVLLISQILFTIGIVFNGININLVNPNIKPKANGDPEEINITYMLIIGLSIAALFGISSILMSKLVANGKTYAYLINIGLGLVYIVVNFLVFWFTANKRYRRRTYEKID